MTKFLLTFVFAASCSFLSKANATEKHVDFKVPKEAMAAYMAGCKKGLAQANSKMDRKDIEMLCSDPFLTGKSNESAQDKARRMKLINKSNEDKEKMTAKFIQSKDDVKPCFDAILANDPSKDLQDVKMLCLNPYLTATQGESEADQARRNRLIKESDSDKLRMLEQIAVPMGSQNKKVSESATAN